MSGTKHTPGPWRIVGPITRNGFRLPQPSIVGPDDEAVVEWPGFDGLDRAKKEMCANQRLIAAAPDLLEAAKRALGWLREAYGHANAPYNESAHRAINDLVAAIAKAEGR